MFNSKIYKVISRTFRVSKYTYDLAGDVSVYEHSYRFKRDAKKKVSDEIREFSEWYGDSKCEEVYTLMDTEDRKVMIAYNAKLEAITYRDISIVESYIS